MTEVYYQVCQVLQSASAVTKCDRLLLQIASGIIKCDRLLLQSALGITKCVAVITKWDVTPLISWLVM